MIIADIFINSSSDSNFSYDFHESANFFCYILYILLVCVCFSGIGSGFGNSALLKLTQSSPTVCIY